MEERGKTGQDKTGYQLAEGNIFTAVMRYMLPLAGALFLQTIYSAVDVFVVGRFGTREGISAIAIGSSLINTIVLILGSLATGTTILLGRYLVEGRRERLGRIVGNAVVLFAAIGVILTILLLLGAPLWADLMQSPEGTAEKITSYVRICGCGMVFIIGYHLISSIFRGVGHPALPLAVAGIAAAVNILGDLLLVEGLQMDVEGAAVATVVSQAISLLLSILIYRRKRLPFRISREDFYFGTETKKILLSGFPLAMQEFLTQLSFLVLLALINGMGTTEEIQLASSSGYGIAGKIVGMLMIVPGALAQSMTVIISQNVAAGEEKRAQKAMGYGMLIGALVGFAMTSAAYFGGGILSAIFTPSREFQLKAVEYLQGFSIEAIATSVLFSYMGYFNGHNKSFFGIVQGFALSFLVRLPIAFFMAKQFPDSLMYVGFASPCATILGILVSTVYFFISTQNFREEEIGE